jgi:hypothetical protein
MHILQNLHAAAVIFLIFDTFMYLFGQNKVRLEGIWQNRRSLSVEKATKERAIPQNEEAGR